MFITVKGHFGIFMDFLMHEKIRHQTFPSVSMTKGDFPLQATDMGSLILMAVILIKDSDDLPYRKQFGEIRKRKLSSKTSFPFIPIIMNEKEEAW